MRRMLLWLFIVLALFSSCATGPQVKPGAVIAIWDFEDLTYENQIYPDLGALLTGKAIEYIQNEGVYSVVERQKLEIILDELNMAASEIASEATRLRLGRLAGARWMVFGAYQIIGDRIRLDLRLVDVETGSILKARKRLFPKTDPNEWIKAAGVVMELF